nr:hypothetical protein [Tanacetum cinerariifolium]
MKTENEFTELLTSGPYRLDGANVEVEQYNGYDLIESKDGLDDLKEESHGSSRSLSYQVNLLDPAQRRKTPLVLPLERIPRLDSSVRIR